MGTASTDHNHNMGVIDELLTAAGNFDDVSSLGEGSAMLVACEDDLDVEEDALEDGPSSASEAMPHLSLPGHQAEGEGGQLTTRLSEMALTNHDDATLEIRPEEMMTPSIIRSAAIVIDIDFGINRRCTISIS